MAKIFVDVTTPGNGREYEFELDDAMTVEAAKARMIEEIALIENDRAEFDGQTILNDLTGGQILPDNAPLSVMNVKSGQRLILV